MSGPKIGGAAITLEDEIAPSPKGQLTIDDVARAAEVSRSTVSLVLRNSPLVAEATSRKVRDKIAELGYVYNRQAAIRARYSHLIGIIIPDLANPFFAELTAGIDGWLNQEGWVSLLGNSWDSSDQQNLILQRMLEHNVDAVILCPAVETKAGVGAVAAQNKPLLQVLRHNSPATPYLGIDYEQGMALAVEHLWDLGHRHIVMLGGDSAHSAAAERRAGFERSMHSKGLAPRFVPAALTRAAAAQAAIALVENDDPATAIICFNDVVAMGAIAGLDSSGKTVGRDMSVIGFDNIPEANFIRPQLTTVDSNARELGQRAAQMVLDGVKGLNWTPSVTTMSTRLVTRASTGPAPRRD